MTTKLREQIQQRASSAILQYAIFRWECAVLLAGTLLLTFLLPSPFPWWPIWTWPLLGVAGLAALVYASLEDDATSARVLAQLLREQLELEQLQAAALRQYVERALVFQQQLELAIYRARAAGLRGQLERLAEQWAEWIGALFQLTRYVDTYRRDYRLAERREQLPAELRSLTARRKYERDPQLLAQLAEAMERPGRAWQTLRALDAELQQGEQWLEQQLVAMTRLYSQVELLQTHGEAGDAALFNRLQGELQTQIEWLTGLVGRIHVMYSEALDQA